MKTIPNRIANGTFLLVGSGESYFTEIVKGPDIVNRMMAAMYSEDESLWTDEDREYWADSVYDEDNWTHDPDFGPTSFTTDVGETDHIQLYRIEPNRPVEPSSPPPAPTHAGEHSAEIARLTNLLEEAEYTTVLGAFRERDRAVNTVDLMRDEFIRIKALDFDPEINALCERAISKIEQSVPVLVQRDKAEREAESLGRRTLFRWRLVYCSCHALIWTGFKSLQNRGLGIVPMRGKTIARNLRWPYATISLGATEERTPRDSTEKEASMIECKICGKPTLEPFNVHFFCQRVEAAEKRATDAEKKNTELDAECKSWADLYKKTKAEWDNLQAAKQQAEQAASKAVDTVDLMRDEFQRVSALMRTGVSRRADEEIVGICERAVSQINQTVPVIVQRDRAEQKVRALEGAMAGARERLSALRNDVLNRETINDDADRLDEEVAGRISGILAQLQAATADKEGAKG